MNIQLIAIGNKMPAWVNHAFQEYQKRLLPEIHLDVREIPLQKRGKNPHDAQKIMRTESQTMINMIKPHSYTIALDSRGKHYSSEALSKKIERMARNGKDDQYFDWRPRGLHRRNTQKIRYAVVSFLSNFRPPDRANYSCRTTLPRTQYFEKS
ncbi:MAG: 23S rRNA (pseudouridine(1915)-N(3))-methyltransferase RlmH, partial [Gammaproteobacteria bacterium]|nr:23S rRNA (pseudouridine(1915)-N(3))-methyltransferase RlmH [Gammaproteobacteria bacterium]